MKCLREMFMVNAGRLGQPGTPHQLKDTQDASSEKTRNGLFEDLQSWKSTTALINPEGL